MSEIDSWRKQIDKIDEQLLKLLGERLSLAQKIVGKRTESLGPIRDLQREKVVVDKLQKLSNFDVAKVWEAIFELSYGARKLAMIEASGPVKVAIVGYGRFGKLLHQLVLQHTKNVEVKIFSRTTPLFELENADVVVPAVPIRQFEEVIKQIADHLKPRAIVVDICTVKVHPVKVMEKYLPQGVQILATHPMWGPDSVRINQGLNGLPVVLTPVRVSPPVVEMAKSVCKKLGLVPILMSADEHDRLLAESLLTTDLVGLMLKEMKFRQTPIDTIGTKWLHKIVDEFVGNDTPELLSDMFRFNPYTPKLFKRVKAAYESLLF